MAQIIIDVGDGEREWKEQASQLQTSFYRTYHDRVWWSGIPNSGNRNQLQHIIGQVMYGHASSEVPDQDLRKSGYKTKEIHKIKNIAKRVKKHFKEETSMSVILICAKWKNDSSTDHVFRVWDNNKEYFIDTLGRVYKYWDEFLKENKYRRSFLCYPVFGLYRLDARNEVLVTFGNSPACDPKQRRLYILDLIVVLTLLIGAIILIVAIFTEDTIIYIVGAVIVVASLPYRMYRSYILFKDTKKHL